MAGLPGTGLSGVFYLLLVSWLAIRELTLALKRKHDRDRLVAISKIMCLLCAIVFCIALEMVALNGLFSSSNPSPEIEEVAAPINWLTFGFPLLLLSSVIFIMQGTRLVTRLSSLKP